MKISRKVTIKVDHFKKDQFVDISENQQAKVLQVMKRHNFGGLRASHGVSVSYRSHGLLVKIKIQKGF